MTKNFALGVCLATSILLAGPLCPVMAVEVMKVVLSSSQGDASSLDKGYDQLVDEFFDFVFETYPSWGTNLGLHQYDQKLEDFSRPQLTKTVSRLEDFKKRFADPRFEQLSLTKHNDVELVRAFINGQLLDYQELRSLERDPDRYSSDIVDSVFGLTKRNFAPLAERLKSITLREEQAPGLFEAARQNLI